MADKCTATSRRTGQRCNQWAVPGRTTCHWHGGKTPRGYGLPQTTSGRYSKDLPTRLLADYQSALADPDIIAVREEQAVVRARISELLRRVDTGEAGAAWDRVSDLVVSLGIALRSDDARGLLDAVGALEGAVSAGRADYQAWDELFKAIEASRRLADTERRRLEALEASITKQQAFLLAGALVDAVRRHVSDRRILGAIGAEFGRILGDDGRRG